MKTWPIRYWLILNMVVFFTLGVSPFVIIGAIVCANEKPPAETVTLSQLLSANVARWDDPAWQATLKAQLPQSLSLLLLKGDQTIFRYGNPPYDPTPAGYTQIVVMQNGQLAGVADLYDVSPCAGQIYGTVAVPASLFIQLVVGITITLVLHRYVMYPLNIMQKAAQRIAANNLDFEIPPSRVSEVADVSLAFTAMGAALRGSLTRQADLEQERSFFVSAIAHDLRTPLFALRGYLEGLERGVAATPEKTAHYIAVCQEKANTLERLISDLFAYSRLEFLEQTPQRTALNFGELAQQALDDFRWQAEARHIRLTLEAPTLEASASNGNVKADGPMLARAIGNLLENALRHTPDGGQITFHWEKTNGHVQFSVADSGPGIDPHDLTHIFEPLYRAETSRNRETGGAGLGLTIARRILRAHGGDLIASNRPSGGAEFTGTFGDGK